MAEPHSHPSDAPSASQCSQFPPPSAPQCSQFLPPSARSNSQWSQLLPPSLGGLIPPSHFVLRPRSLGAEPAMERECGHELEAELKALRERSQALEAELEAEKGRSKVLEVELEAEKGRSQGLEAELETAKGRSQVLEAELEAARGRSHMLEKELGVERRRSQGLKAELDAERGRSKGLEAERRRSHVLEAELEGEWGRSQILEMELQTLRGRGLGPEGAEPSSEQVLLSRWRQKVFQLLLQVRLHRGQELQLQGQLRSLGAAVAAGSRQVSLLELRLHQKEQELQGERQALSQERLRAEAAEEELGTLCQALRRLLGTLGVALADVTATIGALGTLSERLGQAQHRLQALVASGRLWWQRQLEGTAGDSGTVALEVTPEQLRAWHQGDTRGGSVPKVPPPCPPEGGDRIQPCLGTVSLAPLVTQLQALGAAILGDIGDPAVPPPLWGQR